jgi:hypothetical protein
MGTRDELVAAVGVRYRGASREEKGRILEEFVAVSGYCRKHSARLLHRDGRPARSEPRLSRRTYDDAVREALVVLWESSDRICGKRLKALIPMLVGSMEQHGHLSLDEEVRARLMKISAATIDRVLAPMRAQSSGRARRRTAPSLAIGAACRCGHFPTGAIRFLGLSRRILSPTAGRSRAGVSSRRWF